MDNNAKARVGPVRRMSSPPKGRDYMREWPARCTDVKGQGGSASPEARGIMKVQITAVWIGLTAATVAGQQSSQRDPSTAADSTVSRPESSTVSRPESSTVSRVEPTREATRQPSEPAPLQLPP